MVVTVGRSFSSSICTDGNGGGFDSGGRNVGSSIVSRKKNQFTEKQIFHARSED